MGTLNHADCENKVVEVVILEMDRMILKVIEGWNEVVEEQKGHSLQ